jgi:8-oxo-dGTP pyrophosphatase MutT (NUDIX family)
MPAVPKPAASLVLMRDGADGGRPQVLLLERDREATVGPGAFVFPGGVVESQDLSPAAAALSPRLSPAQALTRLGDAASAAAALGYYVAAIRETFEEALLLIAAPRAAADAAPAPAQLEAVRSRLLAGELSFLDWARSMGLELATAGLVYFAHWITPEAVPQRFTARFFVAEAPPGAPVLPDGREVRSHRWLEPAQAIALRRQGAIHLMDPTVRNLEVLGAFASTAEALRELNRREVRAILPKLTLHDDGTRTLLYPWDAEYERA